jgi:D-alanine-D-alanine ligase
LTVGVLGNEEPQALPMLEIDFAACQRSGEFFYSWCLKEYQGQERALTPTFYCPARLDPELTAQVQAVAVGAHQALGCRDLSRTDIRLRRDGVPFVLEVNPLPGLDPCESNFPIMTTAAGIAYPALINHLVELAVARLPVTQIARQAGDRETAQTQEPPSTPSVASAMQPGQLAASRSAP